MTFKNHPPHPGEVLLHQYLEPMGLSQKKFAEHLGWTYARLNEIINMRRGITADSALALSEAFETRPEMWLDLQRDWDLWWVQQQHVVVKSILPTKRKRTSQTRCTISTIDI